MRTYRSIGLMSGTSMDGVDAAIIESDGEKVQKFGQTYFKEYPAWIKIKLRKLVFEKESAGQAYIKEVEKDITKFHARIIEEIIINSELKNSDIDIIGFHGHTIDHRPHEKFTWQIGDGAYLAERCGIDVICDFRRNDIENGGQGAPLLPLYHKAVVPDEFYPAVIVNIGGVSNITYIDEKKLIAFDTGPGNALIDDIIFENMGKNYDEEGKIALSGKVIEALLLLMLENPYFSRKPPKSLDRNEFIKLVSGNLKKRRFHSMSFAEKVTTLSEFTIQSIIRSLEHLPKEPKHWLVCGGGAHNRYFLNRLNELLQNRVNNISSINPDLKGDFIEAQGFAFLAIRSLQGLPITLASTTGVKTETKNAPGGIFFPTPGKPRDANVVKGVKWS